MERTLDLEDLKIAKEKLIKNSLTLVIVKNRKVIFESNSSSIVGFIKAIDMLKDELKDSSIADRIVGKAIALLCIYIKAASVYAMIISNEALKSLEKFKVYVKFEKKVSEILNKTKSGICPFEKLLLNIDDPELAYKKLNEFIKRMDLKFY